MRNILTAVARKSKDIPIRFEVASYCIHFGLLLLVFYALGPSPLINGVGTGVVSSMAGYIDWLTLSIHDGSIGFRRAAWLTIGVPLTLVAVGLPAAIVIGQTEFTPKVQSALFAPWWVMFFSVMFWNMTRGTKKTIFQQRPLWMRTLLIALIFVMGVLTLTLLTVVFTPSSL